MIAVLTQAQIVSVERIAQDGTRIRASAGANSFGERETLEKHLEAARAHLEAVKQAAADPTLSAQQKAARERGARERQERLEQALVELEKVEQAKAQQKDKPTKEPPGAGLVHRPRGALDADAGWGDATGVQPGTGDRLRQPRDRRGGDDQRGQRRGPGRSRCGIRWRRGPTRRSRSN